jgi:hypothetical protein
MEETFRSIKKPSKADKWDKDILVSDTYFDMDIYKSLIEEIKTNKAHPMGEVADDFDFRGGSSSNEEEGKEEEKLRLSQLGESAGIKLCKSG